MLNNGPYFAFGSPLLLKTMPSYFKFDDPEIKHIPVWINLSGLGWNAICLEPNNLEIGGSLHIWT